MTLLSCSIIIVRKKKAHQNKSLRFHVVQLQRALIGGPWVHSFLLPMICGWNFLSLMLSKRNPHGQQQGYHLALTTIRARPDCSLLLQGDERPTKSGWSHPEQPEKSLEAKDRAATAPSAAGPAEGSAAG